MIPPRQHHTFFTNMHDMFVEILAHFRFFLQQNRQSIAKDGTDIEFSVVNFCRKAEDVLDLLSKASLNMGNMFKAPTDLEVFLDLCQLAMGHMRDAKLADKHRFNDTLEGLLNKFRDLEGPEDSASLEGFEDTDEGQA